MNLHSISVHDQDANKNHEKLENLKCVSLHLIVSYISSFVWKCVVHHWLIPRSHSHSLYLYLCVITSPGSVYKLWDSLMSPHASVQATGILYLVYERTCTRDQVYERTCTPLDRSCTTTNASKFHSVWRHTHEGALCIYSVVGSLCP